jgi:flagellar biosynthesis protein FliR
MAIVVAGLMNMIAKGIIVPFNGSHELRQMVVRPFSVVELAGAVGISNSLADQTLSFLNRLSAQFTILFPVPLPIKGQGVWVNG